MSDLLKLAERCEAATGEDAMKAKDQPIALDEVETVARALMEVDFGTMGDEEQDRWMAKPLGDEFRVRARAVIAALVRSKLPDDVRERVARAICRQAAIDGGYSEASAEVMVEKMWPGFDKQADAAITAIGSQSV